MSNEAVRPSGGRSPQPASGHRYSQPSTPSNFAYNSPLESRARANDTTPTRPSPLSRMTLPDPNLRGDFPTVATNVDDDVFSPSNQAPMMSLDRFSRSHSDPLANALRNNAAVNHYRQRQQSMQGPAYHQPFTNRPRIVRASPNRSRPTFVSPSFTMQQRQQLQYQHQLAREQQFRLQQEQNQQYHQQQRAANLVSCTLCDARFTVSSESIPPDEQGRAYCAACVGRVSGRVVTEQKARVAAEEVEDDGDVGSDGLPAGTHNDDDVNMADSDQEPGAGQGQGETAAQDVPNQGPSVEGGQEAWNSDLNSHDDGVAASDSESDNARIWDHWEEVMGNGLAHEELLPNDGQHAETASKK